MAHEIESIFYVGETPWHGLGKELKEAPTISDAIIQSGLDWMVKKEEIFLADGTKCPGFATVRETDNKVLGVVGPRYQPLQNKDAFNFFQPFVDSGIVELETAGSLSEGKKVWVLARINGGDVQVTGDDVIRPYVLLSNSHDGTNAIRVGFTGVRVVCANTMAMAHNSDASKLLRVRHSINAVSNLDSIRDIMNVVRGEFEASAEQYRVLANKSINRSDLEKYIKVSLGYSAVDELSTRANNQVNNVIALFENGRGMDLKSARNTYFGAYNAISEFLSHNVGNSGDSRYSSLWFGPNLKKNNDALELALKMAA